MKIRVPVQMLNDASSRLNNMEIQIAHNSNTLNMMWSGLRLEAKSRAAVESRVNQARTMAGRLSSETSSLSKYLVLVNERFVEADRKEGVSIAKTGKEYLSFVGQNGDKNIDAHYDLNKKFASLALINPLFAASLLAVPAGIVGLKWVGDTTYKHGHKWWMPGHAGAAKNLATNWMDGVGADKIAGDLTVDVSKILVGKAIAGSAALALAGVLVTVPLLAGAPVVLIATGAYAVCYFSYSYLSDQIFNTSIKGKSVDDWVKDGTLYNIKTLRENPALILAGPVAPALTSINYFQKELVGVDVISGVGNMVDGLKQKIFSR